jgi:repressor LexA
MNARPPTKRQTQVLRFIADHAAEHGYSPSSREICAAIGIVGTNGAHDHVKALVRKGMVTRTSFVARSTVLTESGKAFLESTRPGPAPAGAAEGGS